jgi:glycosyltransferase involved in cell wall biosynthesis
MSSAALDIVMYVINDVTHDSRVLREAGTLVAAGHRVTIVAPPPVAGDPPPDPPGIEIRRVPIPQGDAWWYGWLRAPWRTVAAWLRTALGGRRGPHRSAALLAACIASLPWLGLRGAWVAVVNHGMGRPVGLTWLRFLRTWRVELLGWDSAAVDAAPRADVHHAHDFEALPAAAAAARRDGTRYVYDSHEIFAGWGPMLRQPWWLRRLMRRWERRLARGAVAMITVNDAYATNLRRRLSPRRIVVVHNCPPRWQPPSPPEDRLRRALNLRPDARVVLYHGVFQAHRGLEQTAAAMAEPGMEAAHLVLLGYGTAPIGELLARHDVAGRVHYLAAVPPAEVPAWVAGADVDVMALEPVGLSIRLSTPNKLFESLAAGVPVVASDLPSLRRVLLDDPLGPLGVLCDPADPRSIASAIRAILERGPTERADLRARCLRAAHERWNWETEGARLVALYEELGTAGARR